MGCSAGRGMAPPSDLEPLTENATEEDHWLVGGRYEVLQQVALLSKPDAASENGLTLLPGDTVLLLALQVSQDWPGSSGSAPSSSPGEAEALLGYMANTKEADWVCGWGYLGPRGPQPVGRKRLRGSWEVHGRYRVTGSPVLRTEVQMESQELYEIQPDEEVLVLEMGLVLHHAVPRLRARVRADDGQLGWLTIELPGGSPLLEQLNLYSEEATRPGARGGVFGRSQAPLQRRGGRRRLTVSGIHEEDDAWEVGGKYRALNKAQVREDPDPSSAVLGTLRVGDLVLVEESLENTSPSRGARLRVRADLGQELSIRGWISAVSGAGEVILDTRDHLEAEKLLRSEVWRGAEPAAAASAPAGGAADAQEVHLRLQRHSGLTLGVAVDHSDGRTLLVQEVVPGGLLAAWNAENPAQAIQPGDRITCANNVEGDSMEMLGELAGDSDAQLDITIQRGPPEAKALGCGAPLEVHLEASPDGVVEGSEDWQQSVAATATPAQSPEPAAAREPVSASPGAGGWSLREEEERDVLEEEQAWGKMPQVHPDCRTGTSSASAPGPPNIDMPVAYRNGLYGSAAPADDAWRPVGVCVAEDGPDWKPFVGEPTGGENEVDNPCPCAPCRQAGLLGSLLGCGAGLGGTPLTKAQPSHNAPPVAATPVRQGAGLARLRRNGATTA